MSPDSKIYVAGHRGMVGSAIVRKLREEGFRNLIYLSSTKLDLRNQAKVSAFFKSEKPDFVFLAAAKVGGILANDSHGADFLYDNLMIESNVIHSAYQVGVKKLLFLGSSCIYPKIAEQPIKEEYLLTGKLERTNEAYSIAKIAGLKLCENYRKQYGCNFISTMPTNLYGVGDNYDLENSHVVPAMIRKFHEAKHHNYPAVELWGSGTPKREFLNAEDLASACFFLMNSYDGVEPINIGYGEDLSISNLAELVRKTVGFDGDIVWNTEMPDGTPRKLLDSTKLSDMGWRPRIKLEEGLRLTYLDFLSRKDQLYGQ